MHLPAHHENSENFKFKISFPQISAFTCKEKKHHEDYNLIKSDWESDNFESMEYSTVLKVQTCDPPSSGTDSVEDCFYRLYSLFKPSCSNKSYRD